MRALIFKMEPSVRLLSMFQQAMRLRVATVKILRFALIEEVWITRFADRCFYGDNRGEWIAKSTKRNIFSLKCVP